MTLRECYLRLGGDYDDVLGRLRTEERVRRFLYMFLSDESYERLLGALQRGDDDEAFRAAHTIKGVCQNLSFGRLYASSAALTEALRGGRRGDIEGLVGEVQADYLRTAEAIRALMDEQA